MCTGRALQDNYKHLNYRLQKNNQNKILDPYLKRNQEKNSTTKNLIEILLIIYQHHQFINIML